MSSRSMITRYLSFWERVDKTDACWEWQGQITDKGYGTFKKEGRVWLAHRYSWEHANGPIPGKLFVCHKCDNPRCVNPDHLFLGTQLDNMTDMKNKNRASKRKGSKHPRAKLLESDVIEIRRRHKEEGVSGAKLSREYKVSPQLVSRIILRGIWTHI